MKTRRLILPLLLAGWTAASGTTNIVRIMPLGDSITHGFWSNIGSTPYNSYRKALKNLLESNGYAVDFVGSLTDGDFSDNQHEGHDGWYADHTTKTNTILGHVSDWLASTPADIVLLHIGTNDLLDEGADANSVSNILDAIYSANSNITVVLALIINVQSGHPALSADISAYNSNLNAMAQARITNGDDIITINLESALDYSSSDMEDRLHPSQLGYDKMATNWYPAVVQAIAAQIPEPPQKPTIDVFTNTADSVHFSLGNLSTGKLVFINQTQILTPPNWSNTTSFMAATPQTNLTLPILSSNAFFRIVIP